MCHFNPLYQQRFYLPNMRDRGAMVYCGTESYLPQITETTGNAMNPQRLQVLQRTELG